MSVSRQRLRLTLLQSFGTLSAPWYSRRPSPLPARPRILLVRPDHIGDLLFATPALRMLHGTIPDAHLGCMVGPWGKAVLENNPHVDELVVCEFPGFSRKPKAGAWTPYRVLHAWAAQLSSQQYDLAIVLRFDHWWGALLVYLARIPRRVGYDTPEGRLFLTHAVPYVSLRHEVLQNLTLVGHALQQTADQRDMRDRVGLEASGIRPEAAEAFTTGSPQGQVIWTDGELALQYVVSKQDEEHIAGYLRAHGITASRPLVAIHPGAGAPVKMWQPEAWAEVADQVAARWNAQIVLTGGSDELDLAWSVNAHMRFEPLVAAGQTSLGQLAALFQRCQLVMGPDCGPLHLAVAVGTPTLHLHGPVDPRKFGPWGPPDLHVVLTSGRACIPCNRLDYAAQEMPGHPCMREILVQSVVEAAHRLLEASRR